MKRFEWVKWAVSNEKVQLRRKPRLDSKLEGFKSVSSKANNKHSNMKITWNTLSTLALISSDSFVNRFYSGSILVRLYLSSILQCQNSGFSKFFQSSLSASPADAKRQLPIALKALAATKRPRLIWISLALENPQWRFKPVCILRTVRKVWIESCSLKTFNLSILNFSLIFLLEPICPANFAVTAGQHLLICTFESPILRRYFRGRKCRGLPIGRPQKAVLGFEICETK